MNRISEEFRLKKEFEKQRASRLSDWAKGGKSGPFKIIYFPTNYCNLHCAICWQRQGVHDYSELSKERKLQLVDEAYHLGVKEFVIGGGGEPLFDWNTLSQLMLKIKTLGMYGLLFTNGTLITPEIAGSIVRMQWDKVLVSIDAATEKTNDLIRGKGSYRQIMTGLKHLLDARGSANKPVIGIGYTLTQQGMDEIPDLIRMAGEMGCEQMNLTRLVVYKPSQRKFALNHHHLESLSGIMHIALKLADKFNILTNLNEYIDSKVFNKTDEFDDILLSNKTKPQDVNSFWNSLCFEPFTNLVIHAYGNVGPCCMSGDETLVSVKDRSLEDIWFGSEFTGLREGVLSRRLEPYCHLCDNNVFIDNQHLRIIGSNL